MHPGSAVCVSGQPSAAPLATLDPTQKNATAPEYDPRSTYPEARQVSAGGSIHIDSLLLSFVVAWR